MKYIVELEKVIKRVVIVEADSDEEADKKLLAGVIEKKFNRVTSQDCYEGWEYKSHITAEEVITSADDIAKLYGEKDASSLERALFKYTDCGMCEEWDDKKITLVGYVEGCDAEHPNETLYFPFTVEKFREVRDRLEKEADEMWHEWNDSEEEED